MAAIKIFIYVPKELNKTELIYILKCKIKLVPNSDIQRNSKGTFYLLLYVYIGIHL